MYKALFTNFRYEILEGVKELARFCSLRKQAILALIASAEGTGNIEKCPELQTGEGEAGLGAALPCAGPEGESFFSFSFAGIFSG